MVARFFLVLYTKTGCGIYQLATLLQIDNKIYQMALHKIFQTVLKIPNIFHSKGPPKYNQTFFGFLYDNIPSGNTV
jgi:hypothetical protein